MPIGQFDPRYGRLAASPDPGDGPGYGAWDLVQGGMDLIDKPGRALRGLVGGRPREALAALPFSDTLGLTDPRQKMTGRDVTDKYGLTDPGDKGWGSWGTGFAADMFLDPLNLAGAGLAAKAAGPGLKGLKAGAAALSGLDLVNAIRKPSGLIGDTVLDSTRGLWNDLRGGRGPTAGIAGSDFGGRLGLKYDDLAAPPPGLSRSDPEWVNNRTWFHGTGHPGLTMEGLDVARTNPQAMYGRGVYTTDSPRIAESYATGSLGRVGHAIDYGRSPTVYSTNSDFGKIMDLEAGMTPDVREMFLDLMARHEGRLDALRGVPGLKSKSAFLSEYNSLGKLINSQGLDRSPGQLIKSIVEMSRPFRIDYYAPELSKINKSLSKVGLTYPDQSMSLIDAMKEHGFHGMTHTGGEVLGGPKHQVVIGVDPSRYRVFRGASP